MGHHLLNEDIVYAEEYHRLDRQSPIRLELIKGKVFAMAGSNMRHNVISQNLAFSLRKRLPSNCFPFISDVKLEVSLNETYYYPDVVVDCSSYDPERLIATQPTLVAEVYSPSTRRTDETEKLPAYLEMPSLKHILFLDPERGRIAHYFRSPEGVWMAEVAQAPEDSLTLGAWGITLPLTEVFNEPDNPLTV